MADVEDLGELEGDVDVDDIQLWTLMANENQGSLDGKKPNVDKKETPKSGREGEPKPAMSEGEDGTQSSKTQGKSSKDTGQATASQSTLKTTSALKPASSGKTAASKTASPAKTASKCKAAATAEKKKSVQKDKTLDTLGEMAGIFDSIDSQIAKNMSTQSPSAANKKSTPKSAAPPKTQNSSKTSAKGASVSNAVNKNNENVPTLEKTTSKVVPNVSNTQVKEQTVGSLQKSEKNASIAREEKIHSEGKEVKPHPTEEEMGKVEGFIADQLFKGIMNCKMPPTGEKYTVTLSPIEIPDLARPSVQTLIDGYPKISFFFKRAQDKSKKTGYAQIRLSKASEVNDLQKSLFSLDLKDKHLLVKIVGAFTNWPPFTAKYQVDLDKAQDCLKFTQKASHVHFDRKKANNCSYLEVSQVPIEASFKTCKNAFPLAFGMLLEGKDVKETDGAQTSCYKTSRVYYQEKACLDAVLQCCSGFKFNNADLNVEAVYVDPAPSQDIPKAETASQKVAMTPVEESFDLANAMESQDKDSASVKEQEKKAGEVEMDEAVDEGVARMTQDVCSTMMDSLNKLKQLDSGDPNVKKILQMQAELLKLQESMVKKDTEKSSKEASKETAAKSPPESSMGKSSLPESRGAEKDQPQAMTDQERVEKMMADQERADQASANRIQMMREDQRREFERRKAVWAKKLLVECKTTEVKKEDPPAKVTPAKKGLSVSEYKKRTKEKEKISVTLKPKEEVKVEVVLTEEERRQEEERQRKEQEMKAQQKLREDLEKVEAAQKQSSATTAGAWDPKAIMQTMQESFQSLSKTLPEEGLERRGSQDSRSPQESSDATQSRPDGKRHHSGSDETDGSGSEPKQQKYTLESAEPPVSLSEEEYKSQYGQLPAAERPQHVTANIVFVKSRKCPVESCPNSSKTFSTVGSFSDHWTRFHTAMMTVRFCTQCTAYFSQSADLHSHLQKIHGVVTPDTVETLVGEARTKVMANPSYNNPWPYTFDHTTG